jgi:hypothetical protein
MAVIVVRELEKVVKATSLALYGDETAINFISGDGNMIIAMLKDIDKDVRYPCILVVQPFAEYLGTGMLKTTLDRVIIVTITNSNNPILVRYNETFEPVLYPIYEEFIKQLIRSVNELSPDYTKHDVPGSQPSIGDFKDYLDVIELNDLKISFNTGSRSCAKTI